MNRLPENFIKNILRTGLEQFQEKFKIDEKSGNHGDIPDSVNDIKRVGEKLEKFVRDNIQKVNWENEAEINEFCRKLDEEVNSIRKKFFKAFSRVKGVNSQEKFEAFVEWFDQLRKTTRKKITDLLKVNKGQSAASETDMEQDECEGSEEENTNVTQGLSHFEELLLEADLPDGLIEPLNNLIKAIELNEEAQIRLALEELKAFEEYTESHQESALWAEAESNYKNRIQTLEDELLEAITQKAELDKKIEALRSELETKNIEIVNLKKSIFDLKATAEKLRVVQESLESQQKNTAKLQQEIELLKEQRDSLAELIRTLESSFAESQRRQASLQKELNALTTQEECLLATIQPVTQIRENVRFSSLPPAIQNALTAYVQVFRNKQSEQAPGAVDGLLKAILKVDADRTEARQQCEALQGGLDRADTLLDENAATIENLTIAKEALLRLTERLAIENEAFRQLPKATEVTIAQKKHIETPFKEEEIRAELEQLMNQKNALEELSVERVEWIGEMEERLSEYLRIKRAVAEESETKAINILEEKYRERIEIVKKEHVTIEARLRDLESQLATLKAYLGAIALLKKGRPETKLATADFGGMTELPTFEMLLETVEKPIESETPEKKQEGELIKVEGLAYTVEFTPESLQSIRDLEAQLEGFKGMSPKEIARILPLPEDNNSNKLDYYEELIKELKDGTFLGDLKQAFVLLGAMRKGDEFEPALSKSVGTAMILRPVGLVKNLSETKSISRAFLKIYLLGNINPAFALLKRKSVNSKWGMKNQFLPRGKVASQVWTKDLMDEGKMTKEQLNAIHEHTQKRAKEKAQN